MAKQYMSESDLQLLVSLITGELKGKVATETGKGLSTNDYTNEDKSKLAGIAPNATANSTDTYLLARENHTGTQSADTIVDGTANKVLTAALHTKLNALYQTVIDDNLTSTATDHALSAKQGRELKALIDAINTDLGDELLGRHEGYDTVVRHELTLAMVASQEQLEQAAQEAEQQAQQAKQAAQTMRAAVADLVPQIADSPLMINILTPALPEWKPGAFNAGDVRTFNGAPYKCVQSHDSTDNPDWTPDATPALWIQYHGTSPDTARPWVQPTGAHDMYKAGEYMIWTDGKIYRCLSDTNFSPAEYAQAWDDWEG